MTAHVLQRSTAEAELISQFERDGALASSPRRAAAFARFSERGLPTRRVETWHYTDLRAAMGAAAPPAPAPDQEDIEYARRTLEGRESLGGGRLVLINGQFINELSDLPSAIAVARQEPSMVDVDDPMAALNEAMSCDALALSVPDGGQIAEPIEIVNLAMGREALSLYSRVAISLGVGARASFVETYLGARSRGQRNATTILNLAEGAHAKHVVLVEDDAELHIESQFVRLAARAELNAFAIVTGGALTRRQIFCRLIGDDAKITLGGLTLVDGTRRADTTLQVAHSAPGGTSREFYRAIIDDEAVGIFQGKVIVENAAQKTDGGMKSQAVLLSPQAQMNAKPELEIFADDVVCGHGATVGSLDPEQLFYLMARGIAKDEAVAMLLDAFGGEAIDRIDDDALVKALQRPFRAWLVKRTARTRGEGAVVSKEAVS